MDNFAGVCGHIGDTDDAEDVAGKLLGILSVV